MGDMKSKGENLCDIIRKQKIVRPFHEKACTGNEVYLTLSRHARTYSSGGSAGKPGKPVKHLKGAQCIDLARSSFLAIPPSVYPAENTRIR